MRIQPNTHGHRRAGGFLHRIEDAVVRRQRVQPRNIGGVGGGERALCTGREIDAEHTRRVRDIERCRGLRESEQIEIRWQARLDA